MIEHLVTRFEAARLDRHQRDLRRGKRPQSPAWERRPWRMAAVEAAGWPPWRPRRPRRAVDCRPSQPGPAHRPRPPLVQRTEALEQRLYQIHLTAGRLALAMPPTGAESEVLAIRAEIADAASERDRLRGEGHRLIEDTWAQVHSWVVPRWPALSAMVVGWLIAHSYAGSHTEAILATVGLSVRRRGAHLVSVPVDTALVHYGLPLVVAALCAYVAHRLVGRVRTAVETVRARSNDATRAAAADARDPRTRRVPEKAR